MRDDFLWVEKYRPKTIEECILPTNIKKTFQDFLHKGEIPNMLLAGPAGCGKTTVAKALCNELGVDVYVINGSDEGRFLDTVRNTAKNFASTVSLASTAKHKVIIIDEADNTTNDVQLLLRAFIEEFSGNCRFIFTCNFKNKILEPLHSRTTVVEFSIKGKDRQGLAASFFKRIQEILDTEGVKYDNKVLVELINKHFPDWRRVLNECQRYSSSGTIDPGILATFSDVKVNDLVKKLKEKDFPEVLIARAKKQLEFEKLEYAVDSLRWALRKRPDDPLALRLLGETLPFYAWASPILTPGEQLWFRRLLRA